MSDRSRFRKVLVLTGDHSLPDSTKPGSRYNPEDLEFHAAMRAALESLDPYEFEFLSDHGQLLGGLLGDPPEFVLNLCDTGFRNVAAHELNVPALLEVLGLPYSGAPPACMAICYDKAIVRMIAEREGIPVPRELYVDPRSPGSGVDDFAYPALIKPNLADGSLGISPDAVVENAREARSYLAGLATSLPGRAALVQEYLPGAEYGFGLIGNPAHGFTALPPYTLDFSTLPEGLAHIQAYEAKTVPTSPYWSGVRIVQAEVEDGTLEQMRLASEVLFARLQCQDYGRFDFRTGADGVVKLMEVNPNPAWDPVAKLAMMAGFAGRSYPQMFEMILEAAQARLAAA